MEHDQRWLPLKLANAAGGPVTTGNRSLPIPQVWHVRVDVLNEASSSQTTLREEALDLEGEPERQRLVPSLQRTLPEDEGSDFRATARDIARRCARPQRGLQGVQRLRVAGRLPQVMSEPTCYSLPWQRLGRCSVEGMADEAGAIQRNGAVALSCVAAGQREEAMPVLRVIGRSGWQRPAASPALRVVVMHVGSRLGYEIAAKDAARHPPCPSGRLGDGPQHRADPPPRRVRRDAYLAV
mmetsp:Transcript_59436/g.127680  ORF Transcript_59436/g.127680 Transcript_59436/m.127680 type:complete len:239 (+) Transcript_59436:789-1505(+)